MNKDLSRCCVSVYLDRCHSIDLIWRYEIVFGLVDVARDDFFQLRVSTGTRRHAFKLYIDNQSIIV